MIVVIAASAPAAQSKNLKKMKRILFFSIPFLTAFNLYAKEVYIEPGTNAQERLQEALILKIQSFLKSLFLFLLSL